MHKQTLTMIICQTKWEKTRNTIAIHAISQAQLNCGNIYNNVDILVPSG